MPLLDNPDVGEQEETDPVLDLTDVDDDAQDADEPAPAPAAAPAKKSRGGGKASTKKKAPASSPAGSKKPTTKRGKAANAAVQVWSPPSLDVRKTKDFILADPTLDGQPLPAADWVEDAPSDPNTGWFLTMGGEITGWFMSGIYKHGSSAIVRLIMQDGFNEMQRGIQLRTSYTGKPNVSALALSRASNADAAFHHLFGNDPEKPCGSCQKGLGPFEGCYVVEGACGNCRWNSANSRCEFHPDNTNDKQKTPAKGGKKRSAPNDLTAAFSKVPRKVLRRIGKALTELADDDESSD